MAAELGLLSLTQLQKLAQHHQQQPHPAAGEISPVSAWMWNPNQLVGQEEDDSWEIRAFEQDTTGNINGTTWPPRSYTCTFCRREFRSAQALGGHMNVHRRDRARLHHQAQPPVAAGMHSNFPSSTSTLLIPAPEFVSTNGGLCLFYSLANPNHGTTHVMSKKPVNSCTNSPSSKPLSQNKSNFPNNNLIISTIPNSLNSSICTEPCASNTSFNLNSYESPGDSAVEELDLELRLGRR